MGVYHEHQLKKLQKYFKPELFQISPINLNVEPFSSIKWINVGYQNMDGKRPNGLSMPIQEFMENMENYKNNKFLDIG